MVLINFEDLHCRLAKRYRVTKILGGGDRIGSRSSRTGVQLYQIRLDIG